MLLDYYTCSGGHLWASILRKDGTYTHWYLGRNLRTPVEVYEERKLRMYATLAKYNT